MEMWKWQQVCDRYTKGENIEKLAVEYNVAVSSIKARTVDYCYPAKKQGQKRHSRHSYNLAKPATQARRQVKEIIEAYQANMSMNDIAKVFGCSGFTISEILKENNIPKRTKSQACILKYAARRQDHSKTVVLVQPAVQERPAVAAPVPAEKAATAIQIAEFTVIPTLATPVITPAPLVEALQTPVTIPVHLIENPSEKLQLYLKVRKSLELVRVNQIEGDNAGDVLLAIAEARAALKVLIVALDQAVNPNN